MKGIFYFAPIDKRFIYTGIISVLLLAAVVWLLPVGFIATENNNLLSFSAYWISGSAAKYGTFLLVLGAGYGYSIRYRSVQEKIFSFGRSVISLVIFLSVFAYINEHVTKPIIKAVRPSHRYLLTETHKMNLLDSVYLLSKDERMHFFETLTKENRAHFAHIDGQVLEHWVTEAGYSFPSGHSFNAFLLATVFAFSLYRASREKLQRYFAIPFGWAFIVALSRVAIGAHSPLDVSVGASLGLLVALLFLYFDTTRKWIIHR